MGSTRLPGKVMLPLEGKSVLAHVICRTKAVQSVDEVCVATSKLESDDIIAQEAMRYGASVVKGSETDVLSRYYDAAKQTQADHIVRITSDCPLIDPSLIHFLIEEHLSSGVDYTSNTHTRTYPRGLDIEIFTIASLKNAYINANQPAQREHVTPYIYQHPELFSIKQVAHPEDYSGYRWTLDTPEDWRVISAIYNALVRNNPLFDWKMALKYVKNHPEISSWNAEVEQKHWNG